jgi:transcription antitermination factor NusG
MSKNRRYPHAPPAPPKIVETITRNPAPVDLDLGPSRRWYLVYTGPRREAVAEEGLREAGCLTFWPSSHKLVMKGERVMFDASIGTFPRYLFASGRFLSGTGETQRAFVKGRPIMSVRDIDGVSDVVGTALGWQRVPNAAIAIIAAYQNKVESQDAKPEPSFAVTPGMQTLVIAGPFMGFAATVIEAIGLHDAKVAIELLGGKVPATMPLGHLSAA